MRRFGSSAQMLWLLSGVPLLLGGCATLARPAILEDASSAFASPEAEELESLRPKLHGEAKENLLKAEAAYEKREGLRAEQYAELALQKIHTAENFVARDAAIAQAEALRDRQEALATRVEDERRDVDRLRALDARVASLGAKLLEKAQTDAAVRAARKAMLDARTRQAEAIGAGAPQHAKEAYDQGVAMLESGVSALELGLLDESVNASATASAKFDESIGRAGVARTALAQPSPTAAVEAEADAALLEAQAAQATAIGAGARDDDPARFGEGQTLLATAERRFDGKRYLAARDLAHQATRAFRASMDGGPQEPPRAGASRAFDREVVIETGPRSPATRRPARALGAATGPSRALRLIQLAEDARADAIAAGMAESDVQMAHSGYLLESARRALDEDDDLRAEEKARESRQILRDALQGRVGSALAGAERGQSQELLLRARADAALGNARAARVAQTLKDGGADCKTLKEGDFLLVQGEKKFQSGDYASALEHGIRASERIGSCSVAAAPEPPAKPAQPAPGATDGKLAAAAALSQARTDVAIAKAEKSLKATEGQALLETADNWYERREYALAEKFAKLAVEAVKKTPGAAAPTAPSKVPMATRESALAAIVKAQRARAQAKGVSPDRLWKSDRLLDDAQSWFDKKAYPEAEALAGDALAVLAARDAPAPSPAAVPPPTASTDDCALARGRIAEQSRRLEDLNIGADQPMAKFEAEAESILAVAGRRVTDGACRDALDLSRDAEPLVAAVERAFRGSATAAPNVPTGAGDRRSATDALSEATLARSQAEERLTPNMLSTFARGEGFLREAEEALSSDSYAEARTMARAATAQFDAVRAAARVTAPATDEKQPAIAASDPSAPPKTTVEQYAEESIGRYQRRLGDQAVQGWQEPYRRVIRALKLRDRAAPLATTAEAKEIFASGNELLQRSRTAWREQQHKSSANLADRAATEFSRLGDLASELDGDAPNGLPPLPTPAPDAAHPAPGTPPVGADADRYRAADAALREARVMFEVCEREACSERSANDFTEGKELLSSAQTALADGRHDYAKELAESARKKLAAALGVPRKNLPAPADTTKTTEEKDAAADALREVEVQRKLCDQVKCSDKDLEGWLRSESNLGAARAAFADGDFVRAESKATAAVELLQASIETARQKPVPVVEPDKGLTVPGDVTGVDIRDSRIIVTPPYDFQSGSATLTPGSLPGVDKLARVILHNKEKIASVALLGFTDNRGNAAINKALSLRRAQTVVDALVNAGVPRTMVRAEGRGADEPIADNATAEGRTQNRRVEVRVVPR